LSLKKLSFPKGKNLSPGHMDYRVVKRTFGLNDAEISIKAGAATRPQIPEAQARLDAESLVKKIKDDGIYEPKFYLRGFINRVRKTGEIPNDGSTIILDNFPRSEKERREQSSIGRQIARPSPVRGAREWVAATRAG
jgi:hypothetical protein